MVIPIATQGHLCCIDRLTCADRVPLNAGNLYQPTDRIACEAERVLHRDLCGIGDLPGRATKNFGKTGCSHGRCRPYFTLATDLSAGDAGALLVQTADGARSEKETAIDLSRIVLARRGEVPCIEQHGRENAGSAIRRCSNNPASGSVLFVHSKRNEVDPVLGKLGCLVRILIQELVVPALCTTAHVQGTWQHPVEGHASLRAVLHRLGDGIEILIDLVIGPQRLLAVSLNLGNGKACPLRELNELIA